VGVVRGSRKLLVDPSGNVRIFDLIEDPAEKSPRDPSSEDGSLHTSLQRARERLAAGRAGPADSIPVDEETRQRLRALGYAEEQPAGASESR
jgi:hypothetical protein